RAANWAAQTSPVTTPLLAVNCPDAADCWAVGGNASAAKIVHTANGASASPTWSIQTPPAGALAQYNDVSCSSTSNCRAVGSVAGAAPLIAATTNGGSTWTAQTPPPAAKAALQGVSCATATSCIAVGGLLGSSPEIIATSNGGSTWTAQTPPTTTTTALSDVTCSTASVCFAVGGNANTASIIATTNGGATWTAQMPPSGASVALGAIDCPSASTCFAVGDALAHSGEILATTNGGTTWSLQADGAKQALSDVSCPDATDCWAVGASGTIVTTTDGSSWTTQSSPTSNQLSGIDVPTEATGKAVGAAGMILGYSGCASGGLNFTPPAALTFPSTTLTGRDQSITTPLSLSPNDQSGSAAGWNLSATSTTLAFGSHTLPTTAAQITAANVSAVAGTCSLPVNQISYPVTIPAGASPPAAVKLFDAAAATGAGPVNVALTANLAVPGNARTGTYTSTWTITLASGP
ncbi:MAG: hypothetical protein JO304_01175, partial [Solirubrobacterales bacterium]|nr:hypothetical protein [Solirubrobacterales bacterium]